MYDDMDDTHILLFFSLWIFPFVHMGYFPLVRSRDFSFFRWFFPRTGVYIVFHLHTKGGRSRGAFILINRLSVQKSETALSKTFRNVFQPFKCQKGLWNVLEQSKSYC
jgi:hypothetical protein